MAPYIDVHSLVTASAHHRLQSLLSNIFDSALNPLEGTHVSADTLASQISQLVSHPVTDASGTLWTIWRFVLAVVKRIPFDDGRMALMAMTMGRLKARSLAAVEICGQQFSLWGDLPLLGYVAREEWDRCPDLDHAEPPNAVAAEQWISLNSFAARLVGLSILPWTNFALWELRSALEQPLTSPLARTTHLTTASEWITHAGAVLRAQSRLAQPLGEHYSMALAAGELFLGGEPGFSADRWRFWRRRLEALTNDVPSADVRSHMFDAIDDMRRLDGEEAEANL